VRQGRLSGAWHRVPSCIVLLRMPFSRSRPFRFFYYEMNMCVQLRQGALNNGLDYLDVLDLFPVVAFSIEVGLAGAYGSI
jgi:hypothetical protein